MAKPICIAYKPSDEPEATWKPLPALLNLNSPTAKLIVKHTLRYLRAKGFDTATFEPEDLRPLTKITKTTEIPQQYSGDNMAGKKYSKEGTSQ